MKMLFSLIPSWRVADWSFVVPVYVGSGVHSDNLRMHDLSNSLVLHWCLYCPLSSYSGWLHRLVSGLPEVSGAAGGASAAEVRSVLRLHPGQLQPGAERGPQPHVVPKLRPGPQWLRGAHFLRRFTYEQGGGRHLVQTRRYPGRRPLFLCLTVSQHQGQKWCLTVDFLMPKGILHYKIKK